MKKPNIDFNLNISKKDAKLLFVLLGIAILLVCYLAVYNPYTKKADAMHSEISQLKPVLASLQDHYSNLGVYTSGIDSAKADIEAAAGRYPSAVRSEDLIMYAIRLEERIGLDVTSIGFSDLTPVLTFQSIEELEGSGFVTTEMYAYQTSMTITFNLSYDQFKDLMDFIAATKERTSLNNLAVSFDSATGALTGSATIDKFFLTDGMDEYKATSVPSVELGRDDLFGTLEQPDAGNAG